MTGWAEDSPGMFTQFPLTDCCLSHTSGQDPGSSAALLHEGLNHSANLTQQLCVCLDPRHQRNELWEGDTGSNLVTWKLLV